MSMLSPFPFFCIYTAFSNTISYNVWAGECRVLSRYYKHTSQSAAGRDLEIKIRQVPEAR